MSKIELFKSFSESKAAGIFKQILSGIQYCHSHNVVHRDLKPENIIFEGNSVSTTIKIIDFGRSKILMPNQKISEKAGSVFSIIFNYLSSFIIWLLKLFNARNIIKNAIFGVLE